MTLIRCFLLLSLLLTALPGLAHEQNVAITQIFFNPQTGNIEVAHRLYLHDAEHAVQDHWGIANLYSSEEDQDKLALYVRGNFTLKANGEPLALEPVGHEIDGPFVWVYDEIEIPDEKIETLTIDNFILRDVFPTQTNLVNVELGSFRQSAFFAGEDGEKVITITPEPEPRERAAEPRR